jgi:hypothetical protein
MPEYVIHIGPPKAGSKYLQSSMAALSKEMLKAGINYPTKLYTPTRRIAHHHVFNRLRAGPDARLEEEFRAMNAADHRYIILSCEGFFGLSEEELKYLQGLMGGARAHIVYYCRRWSERIPSLWKQDVKMGRVETLPERYARAMRAPIKAPDLNPELAWDKFASIFGRESIRVVSFNNLVEKKVDLLDHFLKTFVDWQTPIKPDGVMSNESPDEFDTELIRALNVLHLRQTGEVTDQTRIRYLEIKAHLDCTIITEAMKRDPGTLILEDNSGIWQEVYRELEKYHDRLVSPEHGDYFFRRKLVKYRYIRQDYLTEESVLAELKRVYAALYTSPAVERSGGEFAIAGSTR